MITGWARDPNPQRLPGRVAAAAVVGWGGAALAVADTLWLPIIRQGQIVNSLPDKPKGEPLRLTYDNNVAELKNSEPAESPTMAFSYKSYL